ncbi:SDR family oxidoreductase [Umboniibacter marinipuniceus]|uniref:Short-subunit dehydrogenase n=1 Tax=Umboniibacter marinipuniceus TaxID=569599 RepID=A0A3M0A6X8_9GAMM|nr:SDR family oxidoreductase [Umboniibacter marinipuniceus]RMA80064.1 short-subunit dehydrogenase [Umboniibacter marinipuniceus]
MDLRSKVIWITGASSGIGRELAIQLSLRGAKLILTARREEQLEETRQLCVNSEQHKILSCDLNDYHQAAHWAERAVAMYGHVDILVNNAGVSQRGGVIDTPIDVDEALIRLDYLSLVALSKAIMPHFIERQSGYYVNISSVAGKLGAPMRTSYSGAKHAVVGFSDSLRFELFPHNIKVTVICPGYVQTPIAVSALNEKNEAANMYDPDIENGMPVTTAVRKIIRAMEAQKNEVLVANGMPWLGYHLRRLLPNTFPALMTKMVKAKKQ